MCRRRQTDAKTDRGEAAAQDLAALDDPDGRPGPRGVRHPDGEGRDTQGPDEPTNRVPWHMDRHYWQTCTSDRMLTAFIPFHDCDERMGTITMVDGSHRWTEIPGDDSTRHFAQRDGNELEELLQILKR